MQPRSLPSSLTGRGHRSAAARGEGARSEEGEDAARRFNCWFGGILGAGLALLVALLALLHAAGGLPPPPLTANSCMNEKFRFLRDQPLERVTMLAVGSSVTARNLDLSVLAERTPKVAALNAATCYLYIAQTAYYSNLLLEHARSVDTLVIVVAPRDFESCPPFQTEFVDRRALADYVFERRSPWLVYATGLTTRFFGDAWSLLADPAFREMLALDPWGSMPLNRKLDHMPPPKTDVRCFAALAKLESDVAARGVRLVVVHFPPNPDWTGAYDRDGQFSRTFRDGVRSSLRHPTTQVIETDAAAFDADDFADAIHLLWPAARPFTRFVADRLPMH